MKHDLERSCFQLWPKIGDEGDKISRRRPLWCHWRSLCGFGNFGEKILNLGIFFQNFENFQNFELKFPKLEANFDAERGILFKNTQLVGHPLGSGPPLSDLVVKNLSSTTGRKKSKWWSKVSLCFEEEQVPDHNDHQHQQYQHHYRHHLVFKKQFYLEGASFLTGSFSSSSPS